MRLKFSLKESSAIITVLGKEDQNETRRTAQAQLGKISGFIQAGESRQKEAFGTGSSHPADKAVR
jgi:hypothetical protein